ncbi:riboflavin biosynthesis protein RibF [Clostridium omnivorum]|uniref:Riboflavin biosynthesis protein n=1 Tax=Clostridium omnivorum TaxID=1604902 RepID=A0ABQ5NCC8_9CLOT|nr:riboflavin biosynthesis protein RibF [Clostridium sp. E14]GLC32858.1 riboflavin biosynthesis protein [Clostridium sp. E14]
MKYIGENNFNMNNTCVAFGNFDGVHIGHRAVIDKLLDISKQGLTSVVLSFEYDEKLLKDKKILSTEAEKQHILNKNGPEVMISYKIDEKNVNMPAELFLKDILIDKLGAKVIVTSKDHKNIKILRECAEKYGYILAECDTIFDGCEPINSQRILKELSVGTLQKVNELLGHPYLLMGKVLHGKALGRTVGMPTANLGFSQYKQLPQYGVFGTLSEIDGKNIKGLTNIGKRPSVDNYNYVTIETFLLDYSGDLYDKTITLEIHKYIRGVIKFNNLDEVKAQVNKDIKSIRTYLDQI